MSAIRNDVMSYQVSIKSPIFLVGCERSGTTLLRLMLDHHPDMACNLESEYMVSLIDEHGVYPEISAYREWLAGNRVFRHSRFEIDVTLDYVGLLNDFMRQKLWRDNKHYVGATIHWSFNKIKYIWPKAKYIYLYRDGRDVAASMVNMGWAGNSFVAADVWLCAETEWSVLRKALTASQWIEVQYEKLISHTREQLTRICDFVGVEYSESMFDYIQNSTYDQPNPRLNFQWKYKMSPRELQFVESKIGSQLVARGYELSKHPVIEISQLRAKYLEFHSNFHKFLWRLNRYGVRLTLSGAIARRLGMREWQAKIKAQFDNIDDAHLK